MDAKFSIDSTAIELPLFSFDETMLFKIPPATTSRGHCSQEWKQYFMWKGRAEVSMKGDKCKIAFKNPDNSYYGYGFITQEVEKHVEKCYDSMRFFAVKLLNEKGQSLLMGIGFDDRNVAFDFMQSLLKFKKNVQYESKPMADLSAEPPKPKQDFSLKEGEKLTLNFGGIEGSTSEIQPKPSQSKGLKKLAPPPGSKIKKEAKKTTSTEFVDLF